MLKKDFLLCLKSNRYPSSIFEEYFKEHSEQEWNLQAFEMWLQHHSMFGDIGSIILNTKIIPYYKTKFEICELLNKEGEHIKYVEN